MVVDDQVANVILLERVMRAAGLHGVHAVSDPRQAVRRCLEVDADLILLDLHMPHLDGYAVLAALKEALPPDTFLPVVVLTGDVSRETRERALAAGATDFLTKPFDRAEVLLRVHNLLQTRSLYTAMRRHTDALQADLDARTEAERRRAMQRQAVADRIQGILANEGALEMVFQPIADLHTGRIRGVEALARFHQEPRRPPNVWFDEAASVSRGNQLELAAVGAAVGALEHLPEDVFLSVNLSPEAVLDPGLDDLLDSCSADRLVIEVTEHAPVQDYPALLARLDKLRGVGARVAVDDAGAGFAGLQHVLRLRPEILKLDIALTDGIDHDPARRALSTALVSFADEIGAVIVAEGIETREELATLRALGVPWGQGYHLGRPGALADATSGFGGAAAS